LKYASKNAVNLANLALGLHEKLMTIIVILFILITHFLCSTAEISLWQPRQTGLVICRGPTTMGESLFSQKISGES
jgi:hypothetical protein